MVAVCSHLDFGTGYCGDWVRGMDQRPLVMGHCSRGSGGFGFRIKVRGQRLRGLGQGVRTGSRVLRTRARGQRPEGKGQGTGFLIMIHEFSNEDLASDVVLEELAWLASVIWVTFKIL